jgi:hypothetical protein
MAVVHRAVSADPRDVAQALVVKRIRPELSKDTKFSAMLLAEAQLSARLTHPGIVQVTEFGDVDGEIYLAMEEVDGFDLSRVVARCSELGRRMPVGLACFLTRQVALALDFAHALRDGDGTPLDIVHRDVSPHNIMISRAGTVKLLDFGIAKAATQLRDERTRTGMLKGKLTYMSPEQAEGDPIDRRADIFALGVVLWECLTMQRLFRGEHDLETLKLVRKAKIEPPSRLAPDVPRELDAIVVRMLARAPAARYATCGEVAAGLAPLVLQHRGDEAGLRRFVAELGPIARALDGGDEDASVTRTVPEAGAPRPELLSPSLSSSGPLLVEGVTGSLRTRRWGWGIASAIAAAAVGFGVKRLSAPASHEAVSANVPVAAAAAPSAAPPAPAAPAPAPAPAPPSELPAAPAPTPIATTPVEPAPVELRFRGTRGALVQVDGVVIGEIPVAARLKPVPGGKRVVLVRKPGYVAQQLIVAGDRAMKLTVELRRPAGSAKGEHSLELFDPFKK